MKASATTIGPGPPILAIDVGGTGVHAGLFNDSGTLVHTITQPTARSSDGTASALIAQVQQIVRQFTQQQPDLAAQAVGLSVPGIVNEGAGTGVFSSNLGWRDAPIKHMAEDALGMPVAFGHDVRSACQAEYELGAAQGAQDAVILTIGTGIAGGIIVGGRLAVADGYAGEIGHLTLDPSGPLCPCGARGCVEQISSASAIRRRYQERTGREVSGSRQVREFADGGDRAALEVWDEAVDALALTLAQMTAILGPEVVVIGGGLSCAGDALFVPLRSRLKELLSFHRVPRIVPAALLDDAGLLGTGLRARAYASERAVP